MSGDDLVYPALWLQLLEKKLRVPSSGAVEDAYSGIDDTSGWPSRLRAWATGRLNDAELLAAAKDRSQRTEAIFYAAMARHAQGSAEDAKAGFEQVVKSEAIDLVEVSIARDLLAAYETPQKTSSSRPTSSSPSREGCQFAAPLAEATVTSVGLDVRSRARFTGRSGDRELCEAKRILSFGGPKPKNISSGPEREHSIPCCGRAKPKMRTTPRLPISL